MAQQSDMVMMHAMGLNQSGVARLLGTSRQAVNAGIRSKDRYFDNGKLTLIHRALVQKQDPRADTVAQILNERGVQINEDGLSTLGISISDGNAKLISQNQLLKEHLRKEIQTLINSECEKLRKLFDKDNTGSA